MHDLDFDTRVKLQIYQTVVSTAHMPTSHDVARALGGSAAEVEAAFVRLHEKRVLLPEPGDPSRIRMAPPFSGVETCFRVSVGDKHYDANCVWDALGISAALEADATILAADGQTGEPMTLEVRDQRPVSDPCVIHYAVPAAHWWDDLVYT
jgi:hypothetical protein